MNGDEMSESFNKIVGGFMMPLCGEYDNSEDMSEAMKPKS